MYVIYKNGYVLSILIIKLPVLSATGYSTFIASGMFINRFGAGAGGNHHVNILSRTNFELPTV